MKPRHPASASPLAAACLQTAMLISLVWSAVFLAWASLAAVDFGYPLLYEAQGIERHIAFYGPQNRYKHDFESTTKAERVRLFGEINRAVHHQGVGLEALSYRDRDGRIHALLRAPEITHLRSVARLLERLKWVSFGMLAVLGISLALMRRRRIALPRPSRVAGAVAAVLAAGGGLLAAIGPEKVFNTLHTWIFPAGEQWYFFYQESLMTTLMKAPDLFGGIALLLVALALAYLGAALFALRRWLIPGSG